MYQCAFVGVYKGVHELRGFWVAGRALELRERTTQVKYDPTQFFKKLCAIPENLKTKSHKIWDQSVEPFKNGGHFKLPRINLTQPRSNKVKAWQTNFTGEFRTLK